MAFEGRLVLLVGDLIEAVVRHPLWRNLVYVCLWRHRHRHETEEMTWNERTRKERGSTQQQIDDCSARIGRVALAAYLGSLVDSFVHVELIDDLGIVFVVNL